ncbi:hypothetical protein B0H11DRAFT_1802755 [Mycena galericulata]|nr:hypothetical protein B0H11DRAFT_1802755 [Mycena galericulata]
MRDPYWETIHAAFSDSVKASRRSVRYMNRPYEVDPGDFAFCYSGTRLRYVFYEFLKEHGVTLNPTERKLMYGIRRTMEHEQDPSRPCLVLGRHGPDSYVVCFLATLNFRDEYSSFIDHLSIPFGDNIEGTLRTYPQNLSRLLIAMPAVRSNLTPIWRASLRLQLDYGELERARMLVRKKVAEIKANLEAIRNQELALIGDPLHPMNHSVPPEERVKLVQPRIAWHIPSTTLRLYSETPWTQPNLTPHPTPNNIQWLVEHSGEDIVNASRYLSGVVRPPPPPFRLPRPFYSPLLRTATAFARRRI